MKDLLLKAAHDAMQYAYAPYSHYAVGAAILTVDDMIFTGCNVENASFGLTMCAERNAVFKALGKGHHQFKALAIVASGQPPYPCGACLQVLAEFTDDMPIYIQQKNSERVITSSLKEFLPMRFQLKEKE